MALNSMILIIFYIFPDSGGPLQITRINSNGENIFLKNDIGVISSGPPCGLKALYEVFTRVSDFID